MITTDSPISSHVDSAIQTALDRVPPLWPLQSFVAVNPFLGYAGMPFESACERLGHVTGEFPVLSGSAYRDAFESGEIQRNHLDRVADDLWPVDRLIAFIRNPEADIRCGTIPTVADLLDRSLPRAHWTVFIVDEISKWCSVHFDKNQTTWNSPWRERSLYDAWLEAALSDRNPEAFGLRNFRQFVGALPETAEETIGWCVDYLPIPGSVELADFLQRQLMTISGWAGYTQYLAREDKMQGRDNPVLRDLLAIRLAYDAALFSAFDAKVGLSEAANAWRCDGAEATAQALSRWQRAYEWSYQDMLSARLVAAKPPGAVARPSAQAV
ncbi:MAG: putative inorganic carbon transporter subunit DabA, partial [Chthoniobacterales bacterium]